jgi:pSer/pThr/pTyr-binding forkhead associated (FHA) protein
MDEEPEIVSPPDNIPLRDSTSFSASVPPNAVFRMEGGKSFPLDQAIITIGRMLDNHLVIDDARVSRHHAQLRAVDGHYVLTDTKSTGGIFVNGRRVTQTILYPNDSISLAGVILIFHQDEPPPRPDLADTVPP